MKKKIVLNIQNFNTITERPSELNRFVFFVYTITRWTPRAYAWIRLGMLFCRGPINIRNRVACASPTLRYPKPGYAFSAKPGTENVVTSWRIPTATSFGHRLTPTLVSCFHGQTNSVFDRIQCITKNYARVYLTETVRTRVNNYGEETLVALFAIATVFGGDRKKNPSHP